MSRLHPCGRRGIGGEARGAGGEAYACLMVIESGGGGVLCLPMTY